MRRSFDGNLIEDTFAPDINIYQLPGSCQYLVPEGSHEFTFLTLEDARRFAYRLSVQREHLHAAFSRKTNRDAAFKGMSGLAPSWK